MHGTTVKKSAMFVSVITCESRSKHIAMRLI